MKKSFLIGLALILSLSNLAFADFQDVSTNHENVKAINWLQANGVVQGYAGGKFKPDNPINRAEFLKMLYEVIWSYENTGAVYPYEAIIPPLPFSDVPENEWYTEYVREAYLTYVVDGYPDGTFRPADNINFAEAVKIVMNGFFSVNTLYGDGVQYAPCHEALTDYDGIDESAWYWKYIHVADEMCMINFGHSAIGMWGFDPGIFITRADMAELLYRAKTIKDKDLAVFDNNHEPDPILAANAIDLVGIQVGDKVGDMTVIEVGPAIGDDERTEYNAEIKFEGEITVTGTYNYYDDETPFVDNSICLENLDPDSEAKIPYPTVAQKRIWFCFRNKEFAETKFEKATTGTATVVIDKYQVRYAEAEIWDYAELVEVVEFQKTGNLSPTASLYLDSMAFRDNEKIPIKYTCDGQDINPPLEISGVPDTAESLVLIVDDPDAPGGEWNHWTLWNIDPETTKIAENSVPAGAVEGTTSFDTAGYGGPCPPLSDSAHHYYFELSALDTMLDLPAGASKAELEAAMEGHVVEGVLYTGLYESVE